MMLRGLSLLPANAEVAASSPRCHATAFHLHRHPHLLPPPAALPSNLHSLGLAASWCRPVGLRWRRQPRGAAGVRRRRRGQRHLPHSTPHGPAHLLPLEV
ncbi:hypothetical protein GQ55_2G272000 [Panicum hallii var. hallii]|uniref:Uncharacterized protein n=1 Tax=Panicum hallii var. hallii TaxID=1504633 RepID=A0A2T7EST6_9POAL|nr:hypothetical protein GQ55_2G272000 [Panicum hallii var. hallii]